ncbi:MAG TPA: hypothetical protein VFQ25_07280 [Ktedonobacterales bacterium]|nr:hypothetical protein [Ktedonobacterales bacterium]
MKVRWLLLFAGLLALTALWVVNCSGPRPVASDPRVEAPLRAGDPYHVTALVSNEGPGHGEARVTFRLRDTQTGRVYQQIASVTLDPDETIVVGVDIAAPPSQYEPIVEAEYPPR